MNVPVIKQLMPRQASQTQTVEPVEVRPLPFIGRFLDVPRQPQIAERRKKSEILAEVSP